MTLQELEQAESAMQQQWHDLVIAEQQGEPIETLERLYDHYILLAEEYNRCRDTLEARQRPERTRGSKKGYRTGQKDMRLAS